MIIRIHKSKKETKQPWWVTYHSANGKVLETSEMFTHRCKALNNVRATVQSFSEEFGIDTCSHSIRIRGDSGNETIATLDYDVLRGEWKFP
ncbi:MAG: hypothetical protein GY869_14695 [Planctomycetes bacterium]|nr:hypothetical protein [Planctomycetota bacterium]